MVLAEYDGGELAIIQSDPWLRPFARWRYLRVLGALYQHSGTCRYTQFSRFLQHQGTQTKLIALLEHNAAYPSLVLYYLSSTQSNNFKMYYYGNE